MSDRSMRLQVILEAAQRFTAPFAKATKATTTLSQGLKAARDQIRALESTGRQLDGFQLLEQRIVDTGRELKKARDAAAALERKFDDTAKPTKKLMNEATKAAEGVAKLEAVQRKEVERLEQMRAKLHAAGVETGDMARAQERLRGEVLDANRALEAQQKKLEAVADRQKRLNRAGQIIERGGARAGKAIAIGAVASAGVAGVAQTMTAEAQPAMNFEDGMADVKKVVNFRNAREAEAFQSRLLDASTDIPGMTPVELSAIAAAAGRSQIAKNEIIDFTKDAAKMGVAFDIEAEAAGTMMSTWRTAFDLTQPKVVALADQVNALTNTFGGSAGNVAGIVTRIGALGEVAGVSAAQTAAMGALLDKLGLQEDIAATGIKNVMLTMTKGTAATKDQQAAFKALGLDAVQVSKDMQRDAGGTIVSLLERVRRLPKAQQASLLSELFGSESVAAIAPMVTQLDQLKARFALVGDATAYAGSMNKEYLARIATTTGAVGLASNGLQAINIEMGQKLLPIYTAAALKVAGVAKNFRAWTKEHPKLSAALAKSGLVVGAFVAAIAAIAFIVAPILAFIAALGAAAAFLGTTIGAVVGVIMAIVGVVVIAIDAVRQLVQAWDFLAPLVSKAWTSVLERLRIGIAMVKALASIFMDAGRHLMSGLIQGLRNGLGAVKDAIFEAGGKVVAWFKEKLGIRSPSRVFMGLGGFVMAGLDQGLRDGQGAPLDRVRAIAGDMAAGFQRATPGLAANLAGVAAIAAGSLAAQSAIAAPQIGPGRAASPAAALPPINITINLTVGPGQDGDALGRMIGDHVQDALGQALGHSRAKARYEDDDI